MITKKLILLLLCGVASYASAEDGYFTVVGSKLMRQNKPYRVSIHHQGFTTEKTIEIGIKGENIDEKQQVRLLDDGDKEVILNVSDSMPKNPQF
jgi:hypothetical protein